MASRLAGGNSSGSIRCRAASSGGIIAPTPRRPSNRIAVAASNSCRENGSSRLGNRQTEYSKSSPVTKVNGRLES
jgi:hypothetical protein